MKNGSISFADSPPPDILCCAAVVDSTIYYIIVTSKPVSHICFELFAGKFPKTKANVHILNTGEKGFDYKGSCFHRNILVFMCQELVASPIERSLIMRISPRSIRVLEACP